MSRVKGKKRASPDLNRLAYTDALRHSPDGFIVFDTENVILSYNLGAEKIFGYTKEEAVGRPFTFLIPPEILEKGELERLQRQVDRHGRLGPCCVKRLHKNGARIKLELTRSILRDGEGRLIGYEALFRDITRDLEFEREIRLSEKFAAVGQLVSGLAHELGTPLNIINGHAELILSDLSPDHPYTESLQTIISASHRMTALMKSLLRYVSQKEPREEPVNVNDMTRDLLNFLRIQIRKQKIRESIELDEQIPPIMGEKSQIEEMLLNILINAIQAQKSGGVIDVKSSLRSEDGWQYIALSIRDAGEGIPSEVLPRIFEPFFTTKEVGKGTGLGLYITHNLVQQYKGHINVESAPKKGTTVTILLPVGPEQINPREEKECP